MIIHKDLECFIDYNYMAAFYAEYIIYEEKHADRT